MGNRSIAGILLLIAFVTARADDGWIVQTGDAYQFGKQNPNIQMLKEDLRITIEDVVKVDVRFTFVNHGPATRVLMGFPEERGNVEEPGIENFRSWIDGRRVKVQRKSLSANRDLREYSVAWLKEVSFTQGGRREVRVTYETGLSGNASGDLAFDYILSTAKTWQMPIRDFRATVDWRHAVHSSRPHLSLPGALWAWKPSGPCRRTAIVKNFVPRGNLSLAMRSGFWNFVVDGNPLGFPRGSEGYVLGSGRNVMVPREMLTYFGLDGYKLVGRRLFGPTGKRVVLQTGVHMRSRWKDGSDVKPYLYLWDVIRGVGGSFRYDSREKRIDIRLKRR